jgi:YD repeat-containing protein
MRITSLVLLVAALGLFLACGDNEPPPDRPEETPAAQEEESASEVTTPTPAAPAAMPMTSPQVEEEEPEEVQVIEAEAQETKEVEEGTLQLVLVRLPWTKAAPYENRRFTLMVRNKGEGSIRLDRRLLEPLLMVEMEKTAGGAIPLLPRPEMPEGAADASDILKIDPKREESIGFALTEVTAERALDTVEYTVRCCYHGDKQPEGNAEKGLRGEEARSNKVLVRSPPREVYYDRNGIVTKSVSEDKKTVYVYDEKGRLTREMTRE